MRSIRGVTWVGLGILLGLSFSVCYRALANRGLGPGHSARPTSDSPTAGESGPGGHGRNPEPTLPAELQDFPTRCRQLGVLVCQGFDSPADFIKADWPGTGLYPAWDKVMRGVQDTQVKASGASSLRFEIPEYSGPNASGYWRQFIGRSFGEHSTFYVQFRQRFSPEMLTNSWGGETSWKQVIIHGPESTCADVEITTHNHNRWGTPTIYTDCGERGLYTELDKKTPNPNSRPPYLLQQGNFACKWTDTFPVGNCFRYPVNQWVTFYYQISIGDWGRPNSSIKAWVALEGQPYKQWVNVNGYALYNKEPGTNDYSYVTLLDYMTNKNARVSGGPTAYIWYDELIVSTQPIAAPK